MAAAHMRLGALAFWPGVWPIIAYVGYIGQRRCVGGTLAAMAMEESLRFSK